MQPTPDDLAWLRKMMRAHSDRAPMRVKRIDHWLEDCAIDLARQVVVFRILGPGVFQLGAGDAVQVYRDPPMPRALAAAHAAIAGSRPANAAEFVVSGSPHPDNALRNALRRSIIPWLAEHCPPLALAVRYVRVRRSGALFYDPPRNVPAIITV